MKLLKVKIQNFRIIKSLELILDNKGEKKDDSKGSMTVMVGSNSSGKTTVLDAIRLFFEKYKVVEDDFAKGKKPIKITITFDHIEKNEIKNTVKGNKITFVVDPKKSGTIGRNKSHYEWYEKQEKVERLKLDFLKSITPVYIDQLACPTDEMGDRQRSTLTQLIDSILDTNVDYTKTMKRVSKQSKSIDQILSEHFTPRLKKFLCDINSRAEISVESQITPHRSIQILDDNKKDILSSGGGGDHYSVMYAILRLYAELKNNNHSNYVFLIDEPESHQEPVRQDAFFIILEELSKNNQIIVSTHSPRFVSVDKLYDVRIMKNGKMNMITNQELDHILEPKSNKTPKPLALNPGFLDSLFAGSVLVVEGATDHAV